MARQTFFSFHYERDAWRAGQVRNCNLLPTNDQHGFIDSVNWESIKRQGDDAIKRWINKQLDYTSVTVVLIGTETAGRPWVQHETIQSWGRGNGLVGVWIHNIKDQDRNTDIAGRNPFDQFKLSDGTLLSSICKTYDWVLGDGRNNLGTWIEEAFQERSKYGTDHLAYTNENRQKVPSSSVVGNTAASAPFMPRSPWCADNAETRR
ncbi:MAG TPA: TIR domain-containing protein [Acidobacteriaceae bacterium]|nr:TIR domain-containing protein [Acidobacteriaceae bacterium]